MREEVQLTQERLAWACDIDKGYLSQIESGKRVPALPVLQELATQLGAGAADLLAFDLNEPRYALLDAARRGDRAKVRSAVRRLELK